MCEKVRADVHDVASGIGLDTRIGPRFLQPGPGYGGSCFPKDTLALLKTGAGLRGLAADRRGGGRPRTTAASARWAARSSTALGGDAHGKVVALLGLTFKANTDDMRDSPAISIVRALQDAGAQRPRLRSRGHGPGEARCSTT